MRVPPLPGWVLLLLGMGILLHYVVSPTKHEAFAERARLQAASSISTPVPIPLAAGWVVMSGGIAWLVARPRGAGA